MILVTSILFGSRSGGTNLALENEESEPSDLERMEPSPPPQPPPDAHQNLGSYPSTHQHLNKRNKPLVLRIATPTPKPPRTPKPP